MSTQFPEPDVITRRSKPVSVILPIKEYQEMLERLEDAEEAAYLKRLALSSYHSGRSRTTYH